MKLSELHPVFYYIRIYQLRLKRHIENIKLRKKLAMDRNNTSLTFIAKKHQSLLRRKLGSSDPILQENKITNVKIAIGHIDGIVIKPGEIFSFWKLVGKTTEEKGYIEGLQLSRGEVRTGIGGGVCQLANLLYWMALHTPMEVIERHHHSFDPFPDDQRVLPFGSGASVCYNYIDLRFYNPTNTTFQIKVWLTENHLKGAIYTDKQLEYAYHIEEKNHRFLEKDGKNYRENEIWRIIINRRTGQRVTEEFLIHNFSEIKYAVDEVVLQGKAV